MKAILLHFCVLVEICAIVSLSAETPPPNTELYGPYPTDYKEIVMQWLNKQLINPESARIEWSGEPKAADLGKGSEHVYGYLVSFTVNARNRFGIYTGKQKHAVLIHNGEVIKSLGFAY